MNSDFENQIKSGLERLAFGSINDCVKLALFHPVLSKQEIDNLDLFQISELKKQKDGAFEIKFFDRTKAFEKLHAICNCDGKNSGLDEFYNALEGCAKTILNKEGNDID